MAFKAKILKASYQAVILGLNDFFWYTILCSVAWPGLQTNAKFNRDAVVLSILKNTVCSALFFCAHCYVTILSCFSLRQNPRQKFHQKLKLWWGFPRSMSESAFLTVIPNVMFLLSSEVKMFAFDGCFHVVNCSFRGVMRGSETKKSHKQQQPWFY